MCRLLYFITCFFPSSFRRHFMRIEWKKVPKTDKEQQLPLLLLLLLQLNNLQGFAKCINANMFQMLLKIIYFVSDSVSGFSMWPTFRLIQFSIEYQRRASSSSSFFVKRAKRKQQQQFYVVYAENRTNLFEFNTWKMRFILKDSERVRMRACVCVCW